MERNNRDRCARLGPICLVLGIWGPAAIAAQTIYTQVQIPPSCEQTYAHGLELFQQTIKDELDPAARRSHFDQHLSTVAQECRSAYAAGLFDAQNTFHQTLVLEYGMELWEMHRVDTPALVVNQVKREFARRFQQAGLDESLTSLLNEESKFFQHRIPAFIERMRALAAEQNGAVRLGRFVFVQGTHIPPQTLYEWRRDKLGRVKVDADGQVQVDKGSYQRMAENIGKRMLANAQEYCDWEPSLFFGQDSHWYGALRRWWNPSVPSVRATIEEGYFRAAQTLLNFARQLSLKTDVYQTIHQQMLNKQRAVLARDLAVYRRTQTALYAAPLIPVGMAVGTAGFAYAGLAALPAGTSSFALAGGSFFSAANAAALTSLATLTTFAGMGTYQAVQAERNHNGPIRWAHAFDAVLGVTVQSFPLAAFAPAAIGGGAAGIKYLAVSVPSFIQNGMNFARTLRALGVRGSLRAAPRLTASGAKWWFQTWWRNKKVLGFNYIGNMITAVGFEVYSREMVLGGEHRMLPRNAAGDIEWFNWSEYNRHSLVTIGGCAVGGFLFQPALKMKSVLGRSLFAQTLTITSIAISSAVVEGEVDVDRVYFETEWSLMYARWRSEAARPVYLSKFVTGHSAMRQTALTIVLNILIGTLESPVKNYLLDEYMYHGTSPVETFREISLEHALVDLSGFYDQEIESAWQDFFADPANRDLIAQIKAQWAEAP